MDLLEKIEKSRFLGREFLLWLWFESDRREGRFDLAGGEGCEVWLEDHLTLAEGAGDASEVKIKSALVASAPEAREALRQGKLPTRAKLNVTQGTMTWRFVYQADDHALSAVTVPAVVEKDAEESFYERIGLLEKLEVIVSQLVEQFLRARTGKAAPRLEADLRAWVRED